MFILTCFDRSSGTGAKLSLNIFDLLTPITKITSLAEVFRPLDSLFVWDVQNSSHETALKDALILDHEMGGYSVWINKTHYIFRVWFHRPVRLEKLELVRKRLSQHFQVARILLYEALDLFALINLPPTYEVVSLEAFVLMSSCEFV